jgi:sulfatase modifying factor 1
VVMEFVFCPPGEFEMGSPADEPGRWGGREEQVKVKLTKGFWIAETECTQKQWMAIMGSNPSVVQGDTLPVAGVSWNDAKGFMAKLNQGGHLPQGWKAVLPTEAQWEYACRAGTKTAFNTGKSLREKEANFGKKDGKEVPVGSYPPNKWGLYDMHGNVCELCSDYRLDKLLGGEDPKGPPSAEFIMHRGGSWFNDVGAARSANRSLLKPGERCPNVGFRVVCNVE